MGHVDCTLWQGRANRVLKQICELYVTVRGFRLPPLVWSFLNSKPRCKYRNQKDLEENYNRPVMKINNFNSITYIKNFIINQCFFLRLLRGVLSTSMLSVFSLPPRQLPRTVAQVEFTILSACGSWKTQQHWGSR